jgi:hypothetical protein
LISLFLGPEYEGAVPALRWLSWTLFLVGLSNVLGVQIMLPFGMQHIFTRIIAGSGLFNLAAIMPLAYYFGATGASVSIVLTEAIVTALMGFAVWRAEFCAAKASPLTYDFLIAGAGFAGAVCAERLASAGRRVLVVDRRDHIGGNAFDAYDHNGILVHPYGPHIFHTNSKRVFAYLSRFTDWRFYEHKVLAAVAGALYPLPISRLTLNALYKLDLDEAGAAAHFERVRIPIQEIKTSEDVVLSSVGPDLCEKFFRGYTRKQWGLDLSELAAGAPPAFQPAQTTTTGILPIRSNSCRRRAMLKCSTACSIIQTSSSGLQPTSSPFAASCLPRR